MRHKDKTLLGIVNKLFLFKSLLTTPSNVLPLHLSYSNVGNTMEGYKIKSALPFKIFSTLAVSVIRFTHCWYQIKKVKTLKLNFVNNFLT